MSSGVWKYSATSCGFLWMHYKIILLMCKFSFSGRRKLDPKSGSPFLALPSPGAGQQGRGRTSPPPLPACPLSSPFLSFPPIPSPPLPPMQLGVKRSIVSSPCGVRGKDPAANIVCSYFFPENMSDGNGFCFVLWRTKCADLLKLGLC